MMLSLAIQVHVCLRVQSLEVHLVPTSMLHTLAPGLTRGYCSLLLTQLPGTFVEQKSLIIVNHLKPLSSLTGSNLDTKYRASCKIQLESRVI